MASNIILKDTFGYVSMSLRAPAAGRAVVIRGEDKAWYGESRLCELPQAASEFSMKRTSPVHGKITTDAEAAVGGKTTDHCKASQRPALTDEPICLSPAEGRRHPPQGEKVQNVGV